MDKPRKTATGFWIVVAMVPAIGTMIFGFFTDDDTAFEYLDAVLGWVHRLI